MAALPALWAEAPALAANTGPRSSADQRTVQVLGGAVFPSCSAFTAASLSRQSHPAAIKSTSHLATSTSVAVAGSGTTGSALQRSSDGGIEMIPGRSVGTLLGVAQPAKVIASELRHSSCAIFFLESIDSPLLPRYGHFQ